MALKDMLLIRSRIGKQHIMLRGFSKVVDKCSEEFFKQVSKHIYVTEPLSPSHQHNLFNSDLYLASTLDLLRPFHTVTLHADNDPHMSCIFVFTVSSW